MTSGAAERDRRASDEQQLRRLEQVLRKPSRDPADSSRDSRKPIRMSEESSQEALPPATTTTAARSSPSTQDPAQQQARLLKRHVTPTASACFCPRLQGSLLLTMNSCIARLQASHGGTSRVAVEELESSVLERALKEQVFRLAGQWEQGMT